MIENFKNSMFIKKINNNTYNNFNLSGSKPVEYLWYK